MTDPRLSEFLNRRKEQAKIVEDNNNAFVAHMQRKYQNKFLTFNADKSYLNLADPVYLELMADVDDYECRFHLPGYASTMDYCVFRFNVVVDEQGNIENMFFG